MKKSICLLLLVMLVMSGCRSDSVEIQSAWDENTDEFLYSLDERVPPEIREIVLRNRERRFQPVTVSEDELQEFLTQGLDAAEDSAVSKKVSVEDERSPRKLTQQQVEVELDFLFDYLKYSYSAYGYFGGDETILPLKDEILRELGQVGYPVRIKEYQKVLIAVLSEVIIDSHFQIGNTLFAYEIQQRYCYINEKQYFYEKDDHYYTEIDGVEYQAVSIGQEAPETYLKPVLTDAGTLAWAAVLTSAEIGDFSLAVELARPGQKDRQTMDLELRQIVRLRWELEAYELLSENGIPVIQSRSFAGDLSAMINDAESLRANPCLIIDLRGNNGGNGQWAGQWMEAYTGYNPGVSFIYTQISSETFFKSFGTEAEEMMEYRSDEYPGWMAWEYPDMSLIPNDNLVFVLTDSHTKSAGEFFLRMIEQMDNVIVVGTNTAGYVLAGDVREIYLPESKLLLSCGCRLFLDPSMEEVEGRGYEPDLWCPPGESLDRVMKLLENMSQSK